MVTNTRATIQQAHSQSENELLTLKGVGPSIAARLAKLGVETITDLLFHLPFRYQDRTRITPIGSLKPGQQAVIQGEVEHAEVSFRRKRVLLVRVSDHSGAITLRFFTFSKAQQNQFARGNQVRCFGEARRGGVTLDMVHPEYTLVTDDDELEVDENLTPIYPTTEGLHQTKWRQLIQQALQKVSSRESILQDYLIPLNEQLQPFNASLASSLQLVHNPPPDVSVQSLETGEHPAIRRLAVEELVAQNLAVKRQRQLAEQEQSVSLTNSELTEQLLAQLPFQLTAAQQRVLNDIQHDLRQPKPMQRLVQGDVGSGKTVVAALAALHAVASGKQAAVMAPTELLSEQHYLNFKTWCEPLGLQITWLGGKLKGQAKQAALDAIATDADIVVGTHALFQDSVVFRDLALAIIDEQHRFGVHQRLSLRDKSQEHIVPHQLVMTATPIPRTLAMTAYADLDCSIIDELPPGRQPITTVAINESRRDEVISRVQHACQDGAQVYWVCTLVEESEMLQAQAAEDTANLLAEALPDSRVGLVHGRMKSADKETVMQRFKAAELDLLVATTVIEVGVDVPNATLMVIENAERLGLAQLHQLRGRVGRGEQASACVLMYKPPLGKIAKSRLDTLRATNDGFQIAEKDLQIRGPGELLGVRQTGLAQLRIADLNRDSDLLPKVNLLADTIMQQHPHIIEPLVKRWIGDADKYAQA